MDNVLNLAGLLMLALGGILLANGFISSNEIGTISGASLIVGSLSFFAAASIIGLLKEIRDAVRAKG